VGQLFLRLLLMIVVPLVFSSLVVGVAGIGDIRKLGRVGLKSFGYCLVISGISVVIGLTLANTIRPGERIDPNTSAALQARYATDASKTVQAATQSKGASSPLMQVVETIVPKNPFFAISDKEDPNMLHLMFFGLIVGIAITLLPVTVTTPFLRVLEGVYEITAKIIEIIMKFAPYAVACLLFNNTARFGLDLFPVANIAAGVFQTNQDCDPDCVFNVVVECDLADGIASLRAEPRRAAGDQQFRFDCRRHGKSERYGAL
jgi:DAACS family dicarboxylate/amino acid:cation (Na+ or H+) symporter